MQYLDQIILVVRYQSVYHLKRFHHLLYFYLHQAHLVVCCNTQHLKPTVVPHSPTKTTTTITTTCGSVHQMEPSSKSKHHPPTQQQDPQPPTPYSLVPPVPTHVTYKTITLKHYTQNEKMLMISWVVQRLGKMQIRLLLCVLILIVVIMRLILCKCRLGVRMSL